MNDTIRYIIAGILIFLIIVLQPTYLKWLGYDSSPKNPSAELESNQIITNDALPSLKKDMSNITKTKTKESLITVITPLYAATLSNNSGGTFIKYTLINDINSGSKYLSGYNDDGLFQKDIPVSLIIPSKNRCMPCLGFYNEDLEKYDFINQPFTLLNTFPSQDTIYLDSGSINLDYSLLDKQGNIVISKTVSLYSDSYLTNHKYLINSTIITSDDKIELIWDGGLRPTEEKEEEDITYGYAIINQSNEIEDIQSGGPGESIARTVYNGKTNWASVRTKYFISSIISDKEGHFATMASSDIKFGNRKHTPLYGVSVGYPFNVKDINARVYLGPLDVDHMAQANCGLDASMDWGFAPIRPISKGVLWFLTFMHTKLNLNYGFVLLLFAILIRLITGPLTKKSYESSQKMQKIQPQTKKLQKKYKGDPQRLNKETMALYKKHGVNPLGGCLPILLQMPLLWALFMVFRTTIEFRGASFMLWINDLSKPDVVFSLPFTIPLYGNGVAILPIIMGATLLLTMRMSSATMDPAQKPVMYFMNGFFILIFNSFPSGLNLYYTAYNILSFFQQRSIKNRLSSVS